jgi:hypothetical protein
MYLRFKTVLLTLSIVLLGFSIRAVLISHAASKRAPIHIAEREAVPADQSQRIEAELITITTTGFEPSEITRPQGQFFLDVDNRSELDNLKLSLERVNGAREKSANMVKTAPELRLPLDLPPGTYLLRESGHSNWLSTITITAK